MSIKKDKSKKTKKTNKVNADKQVNGRYYVPGYEANEYNFQTILDTQPDGNVEHHANYTKLPNGYAQMMYVHEVQAFGLQNHWLSDLASVPNTILQISTGVEDKQDFIKRLNKADANVEEKAGGGKLSDGFDDSQDMYVVLMNQLKRHNELAMRVYIRLLVFAGSRRELTQAVTSIEGEFTQFKFATLRDFQYEEWRSMWVAANEQYLFLDEHQQGLSMSSADLGGSFWADHTKLEDPFGTVIGTTFTGGVVNFNMYLRDSGFRSRPFAVFLGQPGFGKSTLQKMLIEDALKRGHRVAAFDPSMEYGGLAKYAGGVTVTLDGSAGMINPFEVFATVTKGEAGEEVDLVASFASHIEKLQAIYGFMSQGLSQEQISEDRIVLQNLLTRYYIQEEMWTEAPDRFPERVHLIGLEHDEYPTLREFVVWLNSQARATKGKYSDDLPATDKSIIRIIGTFENMRRLHGSKFDGHTTIPELSQEQFVVYDVQSLMNTPDIFNAMVYSALAMEQPNIINNGKRQRVARRNGEVDLQDVKHTVLVLDEAQNYLSMTNAYNLNFIVKLMEQMRKNYAALMMALPTIKDLVLTDTNTSDPMAKAFYANIRKMFDLLQYRFFFNLPDNDLQALGTVLGNSITPAELHQISKFPKYKTLMNIQADQNIMVNVTVSQEQLKRFNGGD
ncbi:MAG: conjugal transfer protein [Lactobacillaceae bacterium]|jgi:hypothetical protein|nr:conjugal transfer protein [Lactobacillaceae bacterium]